MKLKYKVGDRVKVKASVESYKNFHKRFKPYAVIHLIDKNDFDSYPYELSTSDNKLRGFWFREDELLPYKKKKNSMKELIGGK